MAPISSRTYSLKSVATWSLRERAVCSLPATGPISSRSRLSTLRWMSSSEREKANLPASISARMRIEPARDLVGLLGLDDAGRAEHGDMRLGGENVVAPQPLVEVDGGVYLLHDLRRTCGKAAAPHGVGHRSRAWARRSEREDVSKRNERKRAAPQVVYLVAALVAAIAGFGTVYVSFAPSDNGPHRRVRPLPDRQIRARGRSPA